jgi:hypothetical protein
MLTVYSTPSVRMLVVPPPAPTRVDKVTRTSLELWK